MEGVLRLINAYNNYHKHTHVSSIFSPDSNAHAEDYIKKCVEYGHENYFTTEHGSTGDIFEAKTLCDKYGLHCKVGMEGYIVPDPHEKDKSNYHIIIIPKNNIARRKLNVITSRASIEGYYYRPRLSPEWLLTLDKDDVFITTACVAGLLKDETSILEIFLPLVNHFGNNLFLEVQPHNVDVQIELNKKALSLREELGLRLIAANDSHYVEPNGRYERLELLKGKGITYGDEDAFILDFPDRNTMFERFKDQGVLPDEQINLAINNTLILNECEDIDIDHSIKMPNIYPDLSTAQRMDKLEDIVWDRFDKIKTEENISSEDLPIYEDGIKKELQIIKDTNDEVHTADYFLFNEKNVRIAVNKYDGVLTRGGRGSCGSFYVNRILGMTQLDRFKINLPIFPERFMSTARILENKSLPDIDYNVKSQEPFVKASRELLGEHGCYPMIAYGTMQLSESFRNVCRSKGMDFDEFNDVGKNIDKYRNDPKWKPIIDEAEKYVGTIVSASVHPCAHLLSDKDILEEYGVVRIGEALCVMITSAEADEYKVLKNDYLIVKIWKLIDETFKLVGEPIPPAKVILDSIKGDKRIWDLIKNGITTTLNQIDSDNGTRQAKQYGISSFEEGAFIAAAIRPSFDSWREQFLSKQSYSTGSKDLDNVLDMTDHYILFQENLMQYFDWLGVTPAESIGLIKKISKKKIHQEDFDSLEERLKNKWIENTGSDYMFDDTWKLIQSCISYGFCSAHAAATSLDMCYGAYCKVHHPYEYYTVCFNNYAGDEVRTRKLRDELKYFNIRLSGAKFRHSTSEYSFNKQEGIIYKGVGSIKFMNSTIANEMYELRDNDYKYFTDLLYDLDEKTTLNSRQLDILIKLNFFSEFGDINKLLYVARRYDELASKKVISKADVDKLSLDNDMVRKYSGKETESRIEEIDVEAWAEFNKIDKEELILNCGKYKRDKTFNGYSTKKAIKAYDISIDDQIKFLKKMVVGRYSEIDNRGLLCELERGCKTPRCSISTMIRYQIENLGYVEYTDPELSARYVAVLNLNTKYSPKFLAYSLRTGETCEMKVHSRKNYYDKSVKTTWKDLPFNERDILYMKKCSKKPKQKKVDGEWKTIPGEYVWWLDDYEIINLTK